MAEAGCPVLAALGAWLGVGGLLGRKGC